MSYRNILICILSFYFRIANAQYNSYNIPINLSINESNQINQKVDLSNLITNDFIAISLNLQGNNINDGDLSFSLVNGQKDYPLPLFGEIEVMDKNRFVSELIYLMPEDAGIWHLNISSKSKQDLPNKITGFVRVFVPNVELLDTKNVGFETYEILNDCNCPMPTHIKRQEWGAQFGLTNQIYMPPATYTKVTHLIVHHSAGSNTSSNWKAVVASIFDFHVNTNGWQDVGYNWLIDPNGVIYEGRGGGENVRGAHMCSYNNNTMGVCLLGNFQLVEPQDTAIESLKILLAYKACKENIFPEGSSNISSYTGYMNHIAGHLEGCAPTHTMCPGKFLFSKLTSIRSQTDQFIQNECADLTNTLDHNDALFTLHPNPTDNVVNVSKQDHLKIFNILGKEVTIFSKMISESSMDVSQLPAGIYFIQNNTSSHRYTQKFIKN